MKVRRRWMAGWMMVAVLVAGLSGSALAADPDVALAGAGFLKAVGDGVAVVQGKGVIALQGTGALVITDVGGDARVETEGWGSRAELGPRRVAYFGHGSAVIRGSHVVVTLSGANLELKAAGKGRARFEGTGRVWVRGATHNWSAAGVEFELPPEPAE